MLWWGQQSCPFGSASGRFPGPLAVTLPPTYPERACRRSAVRRRQRGVRRAALPPTTMRRMSSPSARSSEIGALGLVAARLLRLTRTEVPVARLATGCRRSERTCRLIANSRELYSTRNARREDCRSPDNADAAARSTPLVTGTTTSLERPQRDGDAGELQSVGITSTIRT